MRSCISKKKRFFLVSQGRPEAVFPPPFVFENKTPGSPAVPPVPTATRRPHSELCCRGEVREKRRCGQRSEAAKPPHSQTCRVFLSEGLFSFPAFPKPCPRVEREREAATGVIYSLDVTAPSADFNTSIRLTLTVLFLELHVGTSVWPCSPFARMKAGTRFSS